jgi:hypothetical protein
MKNLKRDNWTNEEVIKLLEGRKISGKGGVEDEYCKVWNEGIESAKEAFYDFQREESDYSAMAYNPEEDAVYHIGPILPA